MHTDTQRAYLAGLLDGEGCISIVNTHTSRGRPTFMMSIQLVMTHKATIEHVYNMWGGGWYIDRGSRKAGQQKPAYSIHWTSVHAAEVLREVLPFLVTKKQQAELALEFQKLIRDKHQTSRLGDEEQASRKEFYTQMRGLNKRGIAA